MQEALLEQADYLQETLFEAGDSLDNGDSIFYSLKLKVKSKEE